MSEHSGFSRSKLAFFGTPNLSSSYLSALVENQFDVTTVITRPPKRRGRGSQLSPSPVEVMAKEFGIEVQYALGEVDLTSFEIGIVVAYGRLIPGNLLLKPLVNIHYSLLPMYRGAAPMEASILNGDPVTGVSLMRISEEMDAGPIFDTREVAVDGLYLSELSEELTASGIQMLVEWLKKPYNWITEAVPQSGDASYAPKLVKDAFRLDWRDSALRLSRIVRLERAFALLEGRRILIEKADSCSKDHQSLGQKHGEVVKVAGGFGIQCGEGVLRIASVRPEGRSSMSFESFLRGFNNVNAVRFE